MQKYNSSNERIKRRYYAYLKEANGFSEPSIDAVAVALDRFEQYTKFRDFRNFHTDAAVAFKRHFAEQTNLRTGKALSKSTMRVTLAGLRDFFHWLAGQQGFKSRLSYSDAEYFNLTGKEDRVARAQREQRAPTIEQLHAALGAMPTGTVFERRDRALFAMAGLSGARDGALASLRMKHIDIIGGRVLQDAREVKTKNSKTFTSWFFPVPSEFRTVVADWLRELRTDLLWGEDDALFPATTTGRGANGHFGPTGLRREPWADAEPVRTVFRHAFAAAGLPYFNPHSVRKTLALLGERLCQTPEEMKAWSQNLGHEKVLTTFTSYGEVPSHRQNEIFAGFSTRPVTNPRIELLMKQLVKEAQNQGTS